MDNKTIIELLLNGKRTYFNGIICFSSINKTFTSKYDMQEKDIIDISKLRDNIDKYLYTINNKDDEFLDKLNYNEYAGTLILQLKDYLEEKLEYVRKYTYIIILLYVNYNILGLYLYNNIAIHSNIIYDFNNMKYISNSNIFKISQYKEKYNNKISDFYKKEFIDNLDFSKNINILLNELLDFYQNKRW